MPPLLSAAAALLRYSVAHTQQHRLFHFRSQQQSVASTCILKTMSKSWNVACYVCGHELGTNVEECGKRPNGKRVALPPCVWAVSDSTVVQKCLREAKKKLQLAAGNEDDIFEAKPSPAPKHKAVRDVAPAPPSPEPSAAPAKPSPAPKPKAVPAVAPASPAPKPSAVPAKASPAPKPKAVPAVAPAPPSPEPSAAPAKPSPAPKPKAVPAVAPAPPAPGQPAVAPSANFKRGERVFCKRNNKARVGIVMAVHSDQDPVIYEVQFPQQPKLERWSGVLKYTEKISEWPSYAEFQVGHEVQGVHGFADVVDDGSAGSCRFHDAVQDEDTFGSFRIQMYLHLDLGLDLDVARQVLPRWVS